MMEDNLAASSPVLGRGAVFQRKCFQLFCRAVGEQCLVPLPGAAQTGQIAQVVLVIDGHLDYLQPDRFQMGIKGIQGATQPVIIELGSRDAQHARQNGAANPIGDPVQGQGKHEPVEDDDQRHIPMRHFLFGGAMAIDDMAYLKRFQQRIQNGQSADLVLLLAGCYPLH